MTGLLELAAILALFAASVRLAAFFAGNETGFHRVSFLRLSLDARAGDRAAGRLAWFAQRPSFFLATTLVGGRLATFGMGVAIALLTERIVSQPALWISALAAILLAPLVFVFGELSPKSVYYRVPLKMLRRDVRWFQLCFALLLPVTLPLVWLTRLAQRWGRSGDRAADSLLARTQLVQILSQGRKTGLLADVQSRMIYGMFQTAAQPVTDSMTPTSRILGVAETATTRDVLDHARRYGLSSVPVRRAAPDQAWFGYVRVIDAVVTQRTEASIVRTMPRIESTSSKLAALIQLREAGALYGAVTQGEKVVGIVHAHGLTEQLFRPAKGGAPGGPPART